MKASRWIALIGTAALVAGTLTGCMPLETPGPKAILRASLVEQVVPFTTSVDGSLSYAPGGEIVTYRWAFGDGSSAEGEVVEHTYTDDGTYEITLMIVDEKGLSTSESIQVKALNPPPTADFSYSPKSNYEGSYVVSCSETVTFEADNCTDDGEIVKYEWYFGYRDKHGDPVGAEGKSVTHEFLYAGEYKITLTVTDNDGGQTDYVETLQVVGGPPCYADTSDGYGWNTGGGTCP